MRLNQKEGILEEVFYIYGLQGDDSEMPKSKIKSTITVNAQDKWTKNKS